MRWKLSFLITIASALTALATPIEVTVKGTSCIYFAGRTQGQLEAVSVTGDGSYYVLGDIHDYSKTAPIGIDVAALGSLISISATGKWGHWSGGQTGPDGYQDPDFSKKAYQLFGISSPKAKKNALVGVFLSGVPDPAATPPSLIFGTDPMTTPLLNQTFVIGSSLDNIVIPDGATTLYFGLHNGYEWNNNVGEVSVTITPVPEPGTLSLLGLGVLSFAGLSRRKRRQG